MKTADSDISRLSPSVRNHLDALSSLKGEQVRTKDAQRSYFIFIFSFWVSGGVVGSSGVWGNPASSQKALFTGINI